LQPLFNKSLLCFILFAGVVLFSGCKEAKNNSNDIETQILNNQDKIKKNISEYIIVLKEGSKITDALNSLNAYDIRLIKDLKQDRYLVELKKNPGIERLKNDIIGSEYIKHIQPNFIYTTQ
jgi:hypothetical protein